MNKKLISVLLTLLMISLSACGGISNAKSSTIYIDKKGKVTSVTVESFPTEQYDEEELKKLIDESIGDYNNKQDEPKISLKNFDVKKERARLTITYATSADYEAFNDRVLFWGTVEKAKAAGYDFSGGFIDTNKVTVKGKDIIDQEGELTVIVTNEPVQVKTVKDVLYISDNAAIIDKRLVAVNADPGATENGITFGNSENTYIILGTKKKA